MRPIYVPGDWLHSQTFKAIFIAPSAAHGQRKNSRRGNAELAGMDCTTPASLVYCVTIVRSTVLNVDKFYLTSCTSFASQLAMGAPLRLMIPHGATSTFTFHWCVRSMTLTMWRRSMTSWTGGTGEPSELWAFRWVELIVISQAGLPFFRRKGPWLCQSDWRRKPRWPAPENAGFARP